MDSTQPVRKQGPGCRRSEREVNMIVDVMLTMVSVTYIMRALYSRVIEVSIHLAKNLT